MKFDKKKFRFEPMLSGVIDMARQTYPEFNFEFKGKADAEIYGDEIRLEQVLVNLISNSVKYSATRKDVFIETTITGENKLKVAVKDFGIGIPKEHQQNLFKKFYRVEDQVKTTQGLGIGLYICAEILQRHNCEYGVQSEPSDGTTFYFSIPLN
jgi:two-component system sensor histidine kinase/response regulator